MANALYSALYLLLFIVVESVDVVKGSHSALKVHSELLQVSVRGVEHHAVYSGIHFFLHVGARGQGLE